MTAVNNTSVLLEIRSEIGTYKNDIRLLDEKIARLSNTISELSRKFHNAIPRANRIEGKLYDYLYKSYISLKSTGPSKISPLTVVDRDRAEPIFIEEMQNGKISKQEAKEKLGIVGDEEFQRVVDKVKNVVEKRSLIKTSLQNAQSQLDDANQKKLELSQKYDNAKLRYNQQVQKEHEQQVLAEKRRTEENIRVSEMEGFEFVNAVPRGRHFDPDTEGQEMLQKR